MQQDKLSPNVGKIDFHKIKQEIDEIPEDVFYQVNDDDDELNNFNRKSIELQAEKIANQKIKSMLQRLEELQVESIKKYYREQPILEEERKRVELEKEKELFYKKERERLLKEQEEEELKRNEELRIKKEKDFMEYKNYIDNIHEQIGGLVSNIIENPIAPSLIDLYNRENDHPFTAQIMHQFELEGIIENPTLKQEEDESLINSRFAEQKRREAMLLNETDDNENTRSKKEEKIDLAPLKQTL